MKKTDSAPGIELIEVTKVFERDGARVVDQVSLSVGRGEICGLIGPNGAGKTTLLKLAAGLLRPSSGRVFLRGVPLAEEPLKAKKLLGYAAAEPLLIERMTAGRHLAFIARAFGLGREAGGRIMALAEELGFREALREPAGECPPGVRRNVSLASVFLHDPEVLILDEPWADLDPRAAGLVRQKLKDAAARGRTVLFSTYFLDIARKTAGRLAVMRRGTLAASGSLAALRRQCGRKGAPLETVFTELTR
ncbi:MAG: ABC transporter ATP-binding protein [Spirochaetales bacterium]|nr:ABC transporter ATP-binding protein [Spirochaetales bacterium]